MKKSIYISGIASANLLMVGCMFKIMHWPGAAILLTLATFLFCFHFLPCALISKYKDQEQKKYKWLYIVTFIVFFVGMMSVLFKVQHWPGAGILLFIGIPLPFILFLPVYIYQTRGEEKNGNMNFLGIMFGLIFLAVFSVLLALNVSGNILNRVAANISNNEQTASFSLSTIKKSGAENITKKYSDELCAYIDELKCELLTATDNHFCEKGKLDPGIQIINKENTEIPRQILFGNGEQNKISELKIKINAYRESLLASGKMNPELTELVNSLFDVSNKESTSHGEPEILGWEQREFSSFQLLFVLDVLSQIQSNVRLVESEFVDL